MSHVVLRRSLAGSASQHRMWYGYSSLDKGRARYPGMFRLERSYLLFYSWTVVSGVSITLYFLRSFSCTGTS